MVQLEGYLERLQEPLLETGLSLMKNVLKPLAKIILVRLWLTAAVSAADARIRKRVLGSEEQTTLINLYEEMDDIIENIFDFFECQWVH